MADTSRKSRRTSRTRPVAKVKVKATVKRRSAAAAALAGPLYRKRVVKSAKTYNRKRKPRPLDETFEDA
jgi:stalled ribosome alternative rescue factor ArfA